MKQTTFHHGISVERLLQAIYHSYKLLNFVRRLLTKQQYQLQLLYYTDSSSLPPLLIIQS